MLIVYFRSNTDGKLQDQLESLRREIIRLEYQKDELEKVQQLHPTRNLADLSFCSFKSRREMEELGKTLLGKMRLLPPQP
jgi:hypothetical protein